jgi:hypothetical protein
MGSIKKLHPRLLYVAVALFGAYFLFPFFYNVGVWPLKHDIQPWQSIDPSWIVGLSHANASHVIWGTDLVFTYGPLSFISTRMLFGIGQYSLLFYDLFLACNLFFAFYLSLLKSENKRLTFLIFVTAIFVLPAYIGSGNPVLLMLLLVFWIRQAMENPSHLNFAMQALLVALLFFVKFNTGLVSFVFLFLSVLYHWFFNKQQRWKSTGYFGLALLLITSGCYLLNVSFVPYLVGGLNMISGYNDIMYLDEGKYYELFFAIVAIAICGIVLLWQTYRLRNPLSKHLFVLSLYGLASYILYKQAFTRSDLQHISEFYSYFPFLLLGISDLQRSYEARTSNAVVVAALFICIFYSKKRDEHLFGIYPERMSKSNYFSRLTSGSDVSKVLLQPSENQLPERIKQRIGKAPVDVYPWNIQMLFENEIRYAMRPVFQSYTAYNRYLENLNNDFYNSTRAPRFVLYENISIDNRYPFFDEPKLQAHYLKNYTCIDTFTYCNRLMLLLERKTGNPKMILAKQREYEMNFSDKIFPNDSLYCEVYIEKTIKGKMASLIWHSPTLLLQVETAEGTWHEFRTSTNLLESGLFSANYFGTTLDVYRVLAGDSLFGANKITSYGFLSVSPGMYSEKMKVIEYRFKGL